MLVVGCVTLVDIVWQSKMFINWNSQFEDCRLPSLPLPLVRLPSCDVTLLVVYCVVLLLSYDKVKCSLIETYTMRAVGHKY